MGLISGDTRRRLDEQDGRRWPFKLALRSIATVFALLATILFAASTGMSTHFYGGDDWVDAMPLAPSLLALLYNPVHILLTAHPKLHRPIHPAWPLTVDLFIWGLALPGLVFSVGDGWFWYWQPVELSVDGDFVLCDFALNFWSQPCNPLIYTIGKMEIAANVFLALILIIHFFLFIFSCIAAHRHRLSRARSTRERRNIELQYHRDPEAHRASAPPQYTASTHPSSISAQNPNHQNGAPNHHNHQPNSSISKSFVSSIDNPNNNGNKVHEAGYEGDTAVAIAASAEDTDLSRYKSLEAGQSPPNKSLRSTRDWTPTSDQPPRLRSPVSPINSGSGGGFMDEREFEDVVGVGTGHGTSTGAGEEQGPFADRHAARYA